MRYLTLPACLVAIATFGILDGPVNLVRADEGTAQWIWTDEGDPLADAPEGERFFRKTFSASRAGAVTVDITCDDAFALSVNGDLVGSGRDPKRVWEFDVTSRIQSDRNVLAVRAANAGGAAGLLVRCLITQTGGTQVAVLSDGTWKSAVEEAEGWDRLNFDDSAWSPVRALGEYGKAGPWRSLSWDSGYRSRFNVPEGFRVERVASPEVSGSVVAMTFDEQGRILASRERGPIQLLVDRDGDGAIDSAESITDDVTNCQGLLALDGQIYVVGDGPDGTALYRLTDTDGDDRADRVELIGKFNGGIGEHGPHAVVLGPDGSLYVAIGNHSHAAADFEPDSPHARFYEGDLLPRYEDARGHARGIKAPGGTVVRLKSDGTRWWRVAGGFRNEYDIAFNAAGELFTFDSDMEWDVGLPWYRPVRVCHVVPGGEFGWRSGAAKWPSYYFDSLPSAVDTGRGSPTGVVFYHHRQFPEKYFDAFFIADWSQGQILAIHLDRRGATWKGTREVFATGNPLNVTDLEVGPDGGLYFSCGGRGTEGGVFRVDYVGGPKATGTPVVDDNDSVQASLHFLLTQPQPEAAWSRAAIKRRIDAMSQTDRGAALEQVAADRQRPAPARLRALDLLEGFGPQASDALLESLARDADPLVRGHAVYLLGVHASATLRFEANRLLGDNEPLVRRRACEALVRSGQAASPAALLPLLADRDRWVRFAARRALERVPVDQWRASVLEAEDDRIAVAGLLGLLVARADDATVAAIRDRATAVLGHGLSDDDLLDVLRVIELTLLREAESGNSDVRSDANVALAARLLGRFPSEDWRLNRELARLLAYLQEPRAVSAIMDLLAREEKRTEQIHLAYCARFLPAGWTSDRKRQLLAWYDDAHGDEGGYSYSGYIENFARDFLPVLTPEEKRQLLSEGEVLPVVSRILVEGIDAAQAAAWSGDLVALDRRVEQHEPVNRALAEAVAAALGRAATQVSKQRLYELFEETPDRRDAVARVLAADPIPDDWPLLVRSLDFAGGETLLACLKALQRIDREPDKPEVYRSAIIAGLKTGDPGGKLAAELLARWTRQKSISNWQEWFASTYPNLPPATLPQAETESKWTYEQLLAHLGETPGTGAVEQGELVFEKAQCVKCHRFGARGEGVGPDLTTVRRRFQRKEILESILYPSQVISDQYKSATVVTTDGVVRMGMAAPQGDGSIVLLLPDATKVVVPKDEIDEVRDSPKSAMPDGLLNTLTLQEIAELFRYLEQVPAEAGGN
jgi:putative membrane-bound dehydrogenase-like protein